MGPIKFISPAVLDTHCYWCCRPAQLQSKSNPTGVIVRALSKNTRDSTEGNAVITRHAFMRCLNTDRHTHTHTHIHTHPHTSTLSCNEPLNTPQYPRTSHQDGSTSATSGPLFGDRGILTSRCLLVRFTHYSLSMAHC